MNRKALQEIFESTTFWQDVYKDVTPLSFYLYKENLYIFQDKTNILLTMHSFDNDRCFEVIMEWYNKGNEEAESDLTYSWKFHNEFQAEKFFGILSKNIVKLEGYESANCFPHKDEVGRDINE